MSDKELQELVKVLQRNLAANDISQSTATLSRAKRILLTLDCLVPGPSTPGNVLHLARQVHELGAFISIRQQDPESFTRYYTQLQSFYDLPEDVLPSSDSQQSKVTGLYLMLLLTKGDYADFHTCLESLMVVAGGEEGAKIERDVFISYPVKLEQWLMEGAYDRVWGATKGEGVPSDEFSVFSGILIHTIRSEIASCSEKAYPSLPISNAKNLLFLDSEGAVVEFAESRGWAIKDSKIWFAEAGPEGLEAEQIRKGSEILAASGTVIQNTIGYARELETIV
ncbi:MAG: regulatory particle non-ATPase [Vezdaea aestivalis]|nr:MAG: regulatory particle non-ATPase [Vezdaea aestivalis]